MAKSDLEINLKTKYNGEGIKKLQNGVKQVDSQLKKASGAVNQLTSAFGGLDNKVGKTANAISGLFGSFAAGGLVGLAVSGVMMLGNKLVDMWQKAEDKAKESAQRIRDAFMKSFESIKTKYDAIFSLNANGQKVANAMLDIDNSKRDNTFADTEIAIRKRHLANRQGMTDQAQKDNDKLQEENELKELQATKQLQQAQANLRKEQQNRYRLQKDINALKEQEKEIDEKLQTAEFYLGVEKTEAGQDKARERRDKVKAELERVQKEIATRNQELDISQRNIYTLGGKVEIARRNGELVRMQNAESTRQLIRQQTIKAGLEEAKNSLNNRNANLSSNSDIASVQKAKNDYLYKQDIFSIYNKSGTDEQKALAKQELDLAKQNFEKEKKVLNDKIAELEKQKNQDKRITQLKENIKAVNDEILQLEKNKANQIANGFNPNIGANGNFGNNFGDFGRGNRDKQRTNRNLLNGAIGAVQRGGKIAAQGIGANLSDEQRAAMEQELGKIVGFGYDENGDLKIQGDWKNGKRTSARDKQRAAALANILGNDLNGKQKRLEEKKKAEQDKLEKVMLEKQKKAYDDISALKKFLVDNNGAGV